MASHIKQSVKLSFKAKNKQAKYKVSSKKYVYTGNTNGKTKKYSYVSRIITSTAGKKKYKYIYRS